MAYIYKRPRKDGSINYQVKWEFDGRQESQSFATPEPAEMLKRLLNENGQSLEAANRVLTASKVRGPSVVQTLEKHISLLTGVGGDQLGRYKASIAHHFAGTALGSMPVAAVTHEDVIRWVKVMQAKPGRLPNTTMAAKTLANHHGLLSAAFSTAELLGYRQGNPCKGIKLPKDVHGGDRMRFMTKDEFRALDAALDEHFRPFFNFLVDTGLRFGEATALLAEDFELDAAVPVVRVNKAWKEDESGAYYVGPPKTKRSRRSVPLAASTAATVRPLVEAAGDGLVFTLKEGGVMRSGATFNRAWEPAWRKLGTPRAKWARIHDLRHTHASWMIEGGMDLFQLSYRLGHQSTLTTDGRYAHLMPSSRQSGAAIAAAALAR